MSHKSNKKYEIREEWLMDLIEMVLLFYGPDDIKEAKEKVRLILRFSETIKT